MGLNGVALDSCSVSTGMSQGAILRPLLFIIFYWWPSKDFCVFSTRLNADDTSLTAASESNLDSL